MFSYPYYPVNGFIINWKVESIPAAESSRAGKTSVSVPMSNMDTLRSSSLSEVVFILKIYRISPTQSKAKESTISLAGMARKG